MGIRKTHENFDTGRMLKDGVASDPNSIYVGRMIYETEYFMDSSADVSNLPTDTLEGGTDIYGNILAPCLPNSIAWTADYKYMTCMDNTGVWQEVVNRI